MSVTALSTVLSTDFDSINNLDAKEKKNPFRKQFKLHQIL